MADKSRSRDRRRAHQKFRREKILRVPVEKIGRPRSPAEVLRRQRTTQSAAVAPPFFVVENLSGKCYSRTERSRQRPGGRADSIQPQHVRIIWITGKRLVAAFAGQQNLHMISGPVS